MPLEFPANPPFREHQRSATPPPAPACSRVSQFPQPCHAGVVRISAASPPLSPSGTLTHFAPSQRGDVLEIPLFLLPMGWPLHRSRTLWTPGFLAFSFAWEKRISRP